MRLKTEKGVKNMGTSRETISRWLDYMYETDGVTHMLVVCDTYDYEDYPVYIREGRDPAKYVSGSMQRVMECYSKNYEKLAQLNQFRAFNYD